jgi:hypothetical protein
MRIAAETLASPAQIDAFMASFNVRAARFMAWLVTWLDFALPAALKRDVDLQIRRGGRFLARMIFLHAAWRARRHRFRVTPGYGLRKPSASTTRRLMRIKGLHRGTLIERIERQVAIISDMNAWIARAARRLKKGQHGGQLVVPESSVITCVSAHVTPLACADTS